jgi:hypothetical protein
MARARANGPERPCRSIGWVATLVGAAVLAGCQQTVAFELLDAGWTGAAGTAGNGTGGSDGGMCPMSERLMFYPESPLAIIALDRTTSMVTEGFSPDGSGSKLDAVRAALPEIVNRYATVVRFGFVGFPGKPSSVPSCSPAFECCSFVTTSVFPWGIAGLTSFGTAIRDNYFAVGDQRQIAGALSSAGSVLSDPTHTDPMHSDPMHVSSRSVVLITDGAPGCSVGDGCKDALSAASALNQKGGDLHILGLGPPSSDAEVCLKMLTGQYDGAGSPGDLRDKLDAMFRVIANRACKLDVSGIGPDETNHLRVFQSGSLVRQGRGWNPDGFNTSITLSGDACNALVASGPDQTVICPP